MVAKLQDIITDQSGHHFALWTIKRSNSINIGLTRNVQKYASAYVFYYE